MLVKAIKRNRIFSKKISTTKDASTLFAPIIFSIIAYIITVTLYLIGPSIVLGIISLSSMLVLAFLYGRAINDYLNPITLSALLYYSYAVIYPIGNLFPNPMYPQPENVIIDCLRVYLISSVSIVALIAYELNSHFTSLSRNLQCRPSNPTRQNTQSFKNTQNFAPFFCLIVLLLTTSLTIYGFFFVVKINHLFSGSYLERFNVLKDHSWLTFVCIAPSWTLSLSLTIKNTRIRRIFTLWSIALFLLLVVFTLRRTYLFQCAFIILLYVNLRHKVALSHIIIGFIASLSLAITWNQVRNLSAGDNALQVIASGFDLTKQGEFRETYKQLMFAVYGKLTALENFNDYLGAINFSLPKFLGLDRDVMPLNLRYAYMIDPVGAAAGRGYGFSFLAEAYLNGGYLWSSIAIILPIMLFQSFYKRHVVDSGQNFYSFLYYCTSFFMIWFLRNSFIYSYKTLFIFTILPILAAYILYILVSSPKDSKKEHSILKKTS